MELTFAHYRNRFCMFRTYYALSMGKVKPNGFDMKVIELSDPPSHEQEEALIRGDVQVANIYLPNFFRRKLQGAPITGLSTEWKSTMKGNGLFVRSDGPVQKPQDLAGRLIATHQGAHARRADSPIPNRCFPRAVVFHDPRLPGRHCSGPRRHRRVVQTTRPP